MAGKIAYLSKEWRDEAEKKLKAEITPDKMKNLTSSMSNIYEGCPDGKSRFLFFNFVDGKFAELLLGEGEPPEAEFRITGKYETFAAISRAELGSQKALMTGKLKLKGNMIKALKLASIADRINKVLATIDAEY
ncbi:MAG: SCP2 sterol-binding domain-containing protein [Deltaproteobacteria bacterium]|nr:SCP2 sterol-binding domain-containing protein [Deltaproteobacteria bacterium]